MLFGGIGDSLTKVFTESLIIGRPLDDQERVAFDQGWDAGVWFHHDEELYDLFQRWIIPISRKNNNRGEVYPDRPMPGSNSND